MTDSGSYSAQTVVIVHDDHTEVRHVGMDEGVILKPGEQLRLTHEFTGKVEKYDPELERWG